MTARILYDDYYQRFLNERKNANGYLLHLYSLRVYLAYNDKWKIINRNALTEEEINVMKQLGCFKLTRTERGIRKTPNHNRFPMQV